MVKVTKILASTIIFIHHRVGYRILLLSIELQKLKYDRVVSNGHFAGRLAN